MTSTLADKKKEQVSVPVGKLNDNLPITPMKRKKRQAEQLDTTRAQGATTLLSIHLNIRAYDVSFLWRDGNFSTINQKYVDLDEGLTMKMAIRRAVLNYDQCETARIEQFNKALIIALARLRILAFWRRGRRRSPWRTMRTESMAGSRWSSWPRTTCFKSPPTWGRSLETA